MRGQVARPDRTVGGFCGGRHTSQNGPEVKSHTASHPAKSMNDMQKCASSRTMYRLLDWFGRRMHVDGFDAVLSPQLQWRMPDGVISVLGGQTPGETAQHAGAGRRSGVSSTGTRSTRSGGGSVLPRPYYPVPRPFRSNKTTLYSLGVIHVALPA